MTAKLIFKKSEEDLVAFVRLWDDAIASNNVEEISKYISDDWIIVGTEGITTKSTFLTSISSGDLTHTQMDSDEIRAQIFENTGVVIARGTSSGKYKNYPFSFYEWSMSVFIHDGSTWSCVSSMLTPAKND